MTTPEIDGQYTHARPLTVWGCQPMPSPERQIGKRSTTAFALPGLSVVTAFSCGAGEGGGDGNGLPGGDAIESSPLASSRG